MINRMTEIEATDAPHIRRMLTHESERVKGTLLSWSPEHKTYILNPIRNLMDWSIVTPPRGRVKRWYNPEDGLQYWRCTGLPVDIEIGDEIHTLGVCLQTRESFRTHPDWNGQLPEYCFYNRRTICYECERLRKEIVRASKSEHQAIKRRQEAEARKLQRTIERYRKPIVLARTG